MPRFAILEHNHPFPHWDLLLEAGPVLRSWRILQPLESGRTVPAEAIADHRLMYLDYEGLVSGNRGSVTRVDSGTFEWVEDQPQKTVVQLSGYVRVGKLLLEAPQGNWIALFREGGEVKT